jgi:1,2-diacylglycerol 3-alpha-glucosyltransferase
MFSDYFFPELGGIQDSVAIVGAALGRRGHQVEIVVPRYGTRDYRLVGATPGERDLGLGVRVRGRT